MLTYGSLFTGAGGLEMGVQSVLPGRTLWHSDIDPGACKVLDHRWPDAPNLGDITTIDWATVPRVDVLTGGSPCQDVSAAGRRAGMHEGTRSNLWGAMREAIAVLRPSLVVWENVRGAYSACAASEMGSCPRCVGDDPASRHAPRLRALGRVLGDLCDLGYDAQWYGLRAADVGAPHGRFRVFVFAWPAADSEGEQQREPLLGVGQRPEPWRGDRDATSRGLTLLPTPAANLADNGGPQHPDKRRAGGHSVSLDDVVHALLPTPRATDGTKGGPNQRGSSGDLMLPSAVQLLPTPTATPYGNNQSAGPGATVRPSLDTMPADRWGDYAAAIDRWERILGRPAPDPTEPAPKGGRRLSPAFVEWLMGTPAGHVTDPAIGLTRNQQLKALGNGVVPAQSAAATRAFLEDFAQIKEMSA